MSQPVCTMKPGGMQFASSRFDGMSSGQGLAPWAASFLIFDLIGGGGTTRKKAKFEQNQNKLNYHLLKLCSRNFVSARCEKREESIVLDRRWEFASYHPLRRSKVISREEVL